MGEASGGTASRRGERPATCPARSSWASSAPSSSSGLSSAGSSSCTGKECVGGRRMIKAQVMNVLMDA